MAWLFGGKRVDGNAVHLCGKLPGPAPLLAGSGADGQCNRYVTQRSVRQLPYTAVVPNSEVLIRSGLINCN